MTAGYHELGIAFMKKISNTKFNNKKNLIEVLEFNGTSLWWWMEAFLYLSFAYRDSFEEVVKAIHTKTEMNKTIKYHIAKMIKKQLIKPYLTCRSLIRKKQWQILEPIKTNKIPLLLLYWHDKGNKPYVQPIIDKIDKTKYQIYALDIIGPEEFDNNVFKEKAQDKIVSHILIENYFFPEDKKELNMYIKKFNRIKKQLIKDKNFQKLFVINGVNIWDLCKPQFVWFFDVRMKDYLIQYISARNVINTIQPKIVVSPSETSEFDKNIFHICKKLNIPTIAIQHGLINDIRLIKPKGHNCPIPTITCVYGIADKKFLLTKGNYPEDSVLVTGNPRWDNIKNKQYDKKEICDKLHININKKIVVFATQPLTLIKNREVISKIISKAINELQDIQFIIKVHPMETVDYYKDILNNKNVVLVKDMDMLNIIYICDSLIMVNSTIGLETLIFDKPLITVNELIAEQDFINYAGNAIVVHKEEDLVQSIKDSLYNLDVISKLKENRERFVYEHCYKIDGNALNRIVTKFTTFI